MMFRRILLFVLFLKWTQQCLGNVISGECRIVQDSSSAVGTPTFEGQSQTTYSCKADENCNYDVHVISNYEGDYNHGFGPVTRSGRTNVHLRVTSESSKPLVLVFVSYEPVNWILNIDFPGRVVSKVLLGSYYLEQSDVTYSSGSVLDVERHSYQTLPSGYGSDTGGGNTDKLLKYVVGRFGPVASFSGSYRADAWTLNIHQVNTTDCPDVYTVPPQSDSSPDRAVSGTAFTTGIGVGVFLLCVCLTVSAFVCSYIINKKKNSHSSPQTVNVVGNHQFRQPVAPEQSHVPTQQNQSHFQFQFQQRTNFVSDHSALPDVRDPQGVLMDSAPPGYDVAINLPSPQAAALQMDSSKYSSTEKPALGSISDNPPPYPG